MSEPATESSSSDWEAVLAEAFAATGGPLTADEQEWAKSVGLCLDAERTPLPPHGVDDSRTL